eukprot:Gb_33834 [translate_table: standard]
MAPGFLWSRQNIFLFFEPMLQLQLIKASFTTKMRISNPKVEQRLGDKNYFGGGNLSEGIQILCKQGQLNEALNVLRIMDQLGIVLDDSALAPLLQGCAKQKALQEGKLVHGFMIHAGFKPGIYVATELLTMYAKCGSLENARKLLDAMPKTNVVSWTVMIGVYARYGYSEEALGLFYRMQRTGIEPNQFTFASVLPACTNLAALGYGKELHTDIIKCGFEANVFVGTALIDMYIKCSSIADARHMFDKMSERNVVSWTAVVAGYAQLGQIEKALKLFEQMPERDVVSYTAMIAACSKNGYDEEALTLFCQMQQTGIQPDRFTFASVLPACANLAALEDGKEIHKEILRNGLQSDLFVGNALVDMYVKCRSILNACQMFDKMAERDAVSWTAMIAGYVQNGNFDEALKLFQKMPERDVVSCNAMIAGYAQNGQVTEALKLFQKMSKRNVVSWNSMIAGYIQNGNTAEALKLFKKMPERNVVSWTAMIAGFAQNGNFCQALTIFQQMRLTGVRPDSDTFASVLPACGNLAALQHGKEVHEDIIRSGFQSDVFVGNGLVDMYAKCGSIENARQVFYRISRRNTVSWNAMIAGYAIHGCGKEALQLFEQMQHSGINPDNVTFIGVLSACCHGGLVDDGWKYFDRMSQYYHITPAVEHYCCMVDLFGRAGRLDEAQDFINKMPIKPEAAVWGPLLGACRIHNNVELGQQVAERLFEMDPKNVAPYVLLSNIYAAAGRWEEIEKVRKMMKDRTVKKKPGCSWIEVNNKMHAFLIGDR